MTGGSSRQASPLTPSLLARAANPRHYPRWRRKRHNRREPPPTSAALLSAPCAGSAADTTPREGKEARAFLLRRFRLPAPVLYAGFTPRKADHRNRNGSLALPRRTAPPPRHRAAADAGEDRKRAADGPTGRKA